MGANCCETKPNTCCESEGPDCECQCHSCSCCGEMSKEKMMFMMMVDLADAAYMKVAKEKMMKAWEKKLGHDMEQSAEFFVEQSMMKWMDEKAWTEQMGKAMETFSKKMEEKKNKK